MTDEGDRRQPAKGGETGRPTARRLEHPPGDRYGTDGAGEAVPPPGERAEATEVRAAAPGERTEPPEERPAGAPSIGRGVVYGAGSVLAVAAAWAIAGGLFDISWGLAVVAALGGWIIGSAVAYGAWGVAVHEPDARVRRVAAGLGAATWVAGSIGSYLVGLVTLPGSTASLGERIANAPFVDALASQFSLIDVLEIVVLAAVAWRAAR